MDNLIKNIYESYRKYTAESYNYSTEELNKLKVTALLTQSFNLEQQKLFEELEYLTKKLNHKYNEQLISFSIDYFKKHS